MFYQRAYIYIYICVMCVWIYRYTETYIYIYIKFVSARMSVYFCACLCLLSRCQKYLRLLSALSLSLSLSLSLWNVSVDRIQIANASSNSNRCLPFLHLIGKCLAAPSHPPPAWLPHARYLHRPQPPTSSLLRLLSLSSYPPYLPNYNVLRDPPRYADNISSSSFHLTLSLS